MFYLGSKAVPSSLRDQLLWKSKGLLLLKIGGVLGVIGGKGDCFEDAFLSVTENAVLKQCSALVRPLLRSCNSDFFSSK